jgi:hypothetical protein
MCSIKQLPAYQAAKSVVSTKVDEVLAKADETSSGWSQVHFYYELRGDSMPSIVCFCSHYKHDPDSHCFLVLILLNV